MKRLPWRLRAAIFHCAFHVAHDEFMRYSARFAFAPNLEESLRRLRKAGFAPKGIVDVGAYQGNWGRLAHRIWPQAHITLIEAQRELAVEGERCANEVNGTWVCALLGATSGSIVEFVVMGTGSSVFEEHSNVCRKNESRRLETLDDIISREMTVDMIKVDAEGYELQVLAGGERCLKQASVVILEVSLLATNRGAPEIAEVLTYMAKRGFVAYDIVEFHRRPVDRVLHKIDVLFVKKNAEQRNERRHSVGTRQAAAV